jgi:hypothetical protein
MNDELVLCHRSGLPLIPCTGLQDSGSGRGFAPPFKYKPSPEGLLAMSLPDTEWNLTPGHLSSLLRFLSSLLLSEMVFSSLPPESQKLPALLKSP